MVKKSMAGNLTLCTVFSFLIVNTPPSHAENRPGIGKIFRRPQGPSPRIIGGTETEQGRYPYMVSLFEEYRQPCGGVLVAPDVVLTAAHCGGDLISAHVGRWNFRDGGDGHEEFRILSQDDIHPLYDEDLLPFDFLLLKLDGQSTKPYIRLNEDPALPAGEISDEVTALGFGCTVHGENQCSVPPILQEVDLTYVSNEECRMSTDGTQDYFDLITDDMLCAGDQGQDGCKGDSGGPLIIRRDTYEDDLLVGITSWGFGCALPDFPGVYARVSHQIEWLKFKLCSISVSPPPDYDCDEILYLGDRVIPVTIIIQFDDFPSEIGWSILDRRTNAVIVDAAVGTYEGSGPRVEETVFLPAGFECIFVVEDSYGDGLCCNKPGSYRMLLGRNPAGKVLASGGGNFKYQTSHEFDVPFLLPDDSSGDDIPVGDGEIALTVVLQLDNAPQEVGWKIQKLHIEAETVVNVPPGIYTTQQEWALIVRTVVLMEGELYSFRLSDILGDGIDNGYLRLFLGTTDINDNDSKIFETTGNFGDVAEYMFVASTDPDFSNQPGEDDSYLTVELRFDPYPDEISFQLRASVVEDGDDNNVDISLSRQEDLGEDKLIFFRGPQYYAGQVGKIVREVIPYQPAKSGMTRQFTFIIRDTYGDGLCCNFVQGLNAGYTIYDGEPNVNNLIVTSQFKESGQEVQIFNIKSNIIDGPTPSPNADIPSVTIRVNILLDVFPDATGFFIEDMSNRRVVEVLPGSYRSPYGVVEEFYVLPIGIYSFTIVDVFGGTENRASRNYQVDFGVNDARPPLVKGNGVFGTSESQIFVLEGYRATYPLKIEFKTDSKPTEFGFNIKRLDLLESDALVAKQPPGSYSTPEKDVVESVMVKEGGLYRIVFEDAGQDGIAGNIRIVVGSEEDGKATAYTVDASDLKEWQVKIFAGDDDSASVSSRKELSLRLKFDRYPFEIEWILLADPLPGSVSSNGQTLTDHEVIAYGPDELYDQSLENSELTVTIPIPDYAGERRFTFIATDSAGDGVCCAFGNGGPIELFEGPPGEGGTLLLSNEFKETGRVVESFTLVGAGAPQSSAESTYHWEASSSWTWSILSMTMLNLLILGRR